MKKQHLILLLSLALGVIIGKTIYPKQIFNSVHAEKSIKSNFKKVDSFSIDSVIQYMKDVKIKHIEFSFAQMQKETAHFTSPIFNENHNMIGMKFAYQRPTTAIGINRGHALYSDWKSSVLDFAILQTRILAKTKDKKDYMRYIDEFYSESANYVNEVNILIKENREKGIF